MTQDDDIKALRARVADSKDEAGNETLARLLDRLEAAEADAAKAQDLIAAASRVSWKFGHDEAGEPSDWTEWATLRECLAAMQAKEPT